MNDLTNRRAALSRLGAVIAGSSPLASLALPAASSTIVVGQSAVMSGPSAALGIEMKEGIEAYFNKVNLAGGVNGRTLKLVTLDDGYEPARAAANTQALINNYQAFGLLGYVGTPTTNAAMPIFTEAKVPLVGPFTGANSMRDPFNRYIFNIRASYMDEGAPIVKALTALGGRRIAVFHQNDAYGQAVLDSIRRALAAKDLTPVAVATIDRNSVDVSEALKTISKAGADGIALGTVYQPAAKLVKGLRAQTQYPMLASVSFIGTSGLLDNAGSDAKGIGIAQVMPYPMAGTTAIAREYQAAMREAKLTKLSYGSIEGFIAAKTFVEGLRRAGPNPTREKFIAGLEGFYQMDLGDFRLTFTGSNHNGSQFTEMTVIGDQQRILR